MQKGAVSAGFLLLVLCLFCFFQHTSLVTAIVTVKHSPGLARVIRLAFCRPINSGSGVTLGWTRYYRGQGDYSRIES